MKSRSNLTATILAIFLISKSQELSKVTIVRWKNAEFTAANYRNITGNSRIAMGIFKENLSSISSRPGTFSFKIFVTDGTFSSRSRDAYFAGKLFPRRVVKEKSSPNLYKIGPGKMFCNYRGLRRSEIDGRRGISGSHNLSFYSTSQKYETDYFDLEKIVKDNVLKITINEPFIRFRTNPNNEPISPALLLNPRKEINMKEMCLIVFPVTLIIWIIFLKKKDGRRIPMYTLLVNGLSYLVVISFTGEVKEMYVSSTESESGYGNVKIFNIIAIFGIIKFIFACRSREKETISVFPLATALVYMLLGLILFTFDPNLIPFIALFQYVVLIIEHSTSTRNRYNLLNAWMLITLQLSLLIYIFFYPYNSARVPLKDFKDSQGPALIMMIACFSVLLFILAFLVPHVDESNDYKKKAVLGLIDQNVSISHGIDNGGYSDYGIAPSPQIGNTQGYGARDQYQNVGIAAPMPNVA